MRWSEEPYLGIVSIQYEAGSGKACLRWMPDHIAAYSLAMTRSVEPIV